MMTKAFLTAFVFVLCVVPQAYGAAANKCDGLFRGNKIVELGFIPADVSLEGIKLIHDDRTSEITDRKDPRFREEVDSLLKMLTDTVFVNGNKKSIDEKGKIHLARQIGEDQTLEFEYVGVKRNDEQVLYLSDISIRKPNGKDISVEKNPLTDNGKELTKANILLMEKSGQIKELDREDIEAWTADSAELNSAVKQQSEDIEVADLLKTTQNQWPTNDQKKLAQLLTELKEIKVPLVIRGVMKDELVRWIQNLNVLSHEDVRDAYSGTTGHTRYLNAKAFVLSKIKFIKDKQIALRQSYKTLLLVGVGLAIAQALPQADTSWIPGVNRLSHVEEQTYMPAKDGKSVTEVIAAYQSQAPREVEKLTADIGARSQMVNAESTATQNGTIAQLVASMTQKENSLGGQSSIQLQSDSNGGSVIVMHFPLSGQFMLLPMGANQADFPTITSVVIDHSTYPQLYDSLLNSFTPH